MSWGIGKFTALMTKCLPWGGKKVVAILPLEGVIGASGRMQASLTLAGLEDLINDAFDVSALSAVAVSINSPGGSPVQSALIMQRLKDLAAEKDVPIYVFCEDVAASGGYMLALAGEEIYAHEASIVGSIGVVSSGFGFDKAIEKIGVDRRVHTAGGKKSLLDPFQPEKEEDVKRLKQIQIKIHDYFKATVRNARGEKLSGDEENLFSGDIWTGEEAVENGLIDGIGELRTVMREKFGEKVKFKVIEEPKGFLRNLMGMQGKKGGIAAEAIQSLDEKAQWMKFGL